MCWPNSVHFLWYISTETHLWPPQWSGQIFTITTLQTVAKCLLFTHVWVCRDSAVRCSLTDAKCLHCLIYQILYFFWFMDVFCCCYMCFEIVSVVVTWGVHIHGECSCIPLKMYQHLLVYFALIKFYVFCTSGKLCEQSPEIALMSCCFFLNE